MSAVDTTDSTEDLEYTYAYTDERTKIDIYRYKDYDMPLEEVEACIADERHYRCIVGDKALKLRLALRYWALVEADTKLILRDDPTNYATGYVFETFRGDKYFMYDFIYRGV